MQTREVTTPLNYRVANAAALVGVHPNTIRRWIQDGTLAAIRLGRIWVVPAAALEMFLRHGTTAK